METELTYTQEQKLLRLAKRFKFDPALVAKVAEDLTIDGDVACWYDSQDIHCFNDNDFGALIAKVLGEYEPTVRRDDASHFNGIQRPDAYSYVDPRYEVAWKVIEETLWDRWHEAIFKFKQTVTA